MKKVFISQPIKGKTDNEILLERDRAVKLIEEFVGEDIEIIDNLIKDQPPIGINESLWFIGKSIELMSKADIAYFINGWDKARGCKIEHECAIQYRLKTIEE